MSTVNVCIETTKIPQQSIVYQRYGNKVGKLKRAHNYQCRYHRRSRQILVVILSEGVTQLRK